MLPYPHLNTKSALRPLLSSLRVPWADIYLLYLRLPSPSLPHNSSNMAEATAADGKMKDLKISETKKSKKDGAPQKAAKKPQQQKKKVRTLGAV